MKCHEFSRTLANGKPFDQDAQAHVASCPFCRALLETKLAADEELDPAQLDRYKQLVTSKLTAVRPAASGRTITIVLLALFLCFIVLAIFPVGVGSYALRSFSGLQSVVYYSVILLVAAVAAHSLTREMIPGARRYVNTLMAVILESLALLGVVAVLFHGMSVAGFLSGYACMRLGLICALLSAPLFALIARNGFFISPVRAGIVGGLLAGLTGFAVLAVHCGYQNLPHIWVWHFGVIPLSMVLGALLGFVVSKFSSAA